MLNSLILFATVSTPFFYSDISPSSNPSFTLVHGGGGGNPGGGGGSGGGHPGGGMSSPPAHVSPPSYSPPAYVQPQSNYVPINKNTLPINPNEHISHPSYQPQQHNEIRHDQPNHNPQANRYEHNNFGHDQHGYNNHLDHNYNHQENHNYHQEHSYNHINHPYYPNYHDRYGRFYGGYPSTYIYVGGGYCPSFWWYIMALDVNRQAIWLYNHQHEIDRNLYEQTLANNAALRMQIEMMERQGRQVNPQYVDPDFVGQEDLMYEQQDYKIWKVIGLSVLAAALLFLIIKRKSE